MKRDNTTSLQSDNVEDIGEINNSLMIESGVTYIYIKRTTEDDSKYLLNYVKCILQYKLLENVMNDDNNMDEKVERVAMRIWTVEDTPRMLVQGGKHGRGATR